MQPALSFLMMVVLALGSGRELLSLVPTEAYWELKHVQPTNDSLLEYLQVNGAGDAAALIHQLGDPEFSRRTSAVQHLRLMGPSIAPQLEQATQDPDLEVATRAADLLDEFKVRPAMGAIWRLMAIRTLGERQVSEALPILHALLDSEEMFVADYARRAINAIEAQPQQAPAANRIRAEERMRHLKLLPAACSVVGQFYVPPVAGVGLPESFLASNPLVSPHRALEGMTRELVDQLERIGNVRVDDVTLGVSPELRNERSFAVLVLRGLHHAEYVRAMLEERGVEVEQRDGQAVYLLDRTSALFAPSDSELILILGSGGDQMPVDEVAAALNVPPAQLPFSQTTSSLIEGVDRALPLWAVVEVSEHYRRAPLLKAWETFVITGEYRDDALQLRAAADPVDPDGLDEAVEELITNIESAILEMQRAAEVMPQFQILVEFLESVEVQVDGDMARGTATTRHLLHVPMGMLGIAP
jgi:hypothetical protein